MKFASKWVSLQLKSCNADNEATLHQSEILPRALIKLISISAICPSVVLSSLYKTYFLFIKIRLWHMLIKICFQRGLELFIVTYSANLCAAIVYVIGRLFHQCQTPQSAQNFFLPKSAVHYLCHLKSNIRVQRRTTNEEKHFYPWVTLFNLKVNSRLGWPNNF